MNNRGRMVATLQTRWFNWILDYPINLYSEGNTQYMSEDVDKHSADVYGQRL